jgi:hypothetical protein
MQPKIVVQVDGAVPFFQFSFIFAQLPIDVNELTKMQRRVRIAARKPQGETTAKNHIR